MDNQASTETGKKRRKKSPIIAIVVCVLLLVAGGILLSLFPMGSKASDPTVAGTDIVGENTEDVPVISDVETEETNRFSYEDDGIPKWVMVAGVMNGKTVDRKTMQESGFMEFSLILEGTNDDKTVGTYELRSVVNETQSTEAGEYRVEGNLLITTFKKKETEFELREGELFLEKNNVTFIFQYNQETPFWE